MSFLFAAGLTSKHTFIHCFCKLIYVIMTDTAECAISILSSRVASLIPLLKPI